MNTIKVVLLLTRVKRSLLRALGLWPRAARVGQDVYLKPRRWEGN